MSLRFFWAGKGVGLSFFLSTRLRTYHQIAETCAPRILPPCCTPTSATISREETGYSFLQILSSFFIAEIFVANIIQDKRGNIEIDQIESRRRKYRFGIFLDYATKAYQFSPLLVLLLPPLFQDTVDRPSYLSIRKQQRGTSSLSLSLSPHYEPDSFDLAFSFSREGRGF